VNFVFFRLRMPTVTFIRSQAFRPGGENEGELLVHFLWIQGAKGLIFTSNASRREPDFPARVTFSYF